MSCHHPVTFTACISIVLILLSGCEPSIEQTPKPLTDAPVAIDNLLEQAEAGEQFWQRGSRQFEQNSVAILALRDQVIGFLDHSDEAQLTELRIHWHLAHNAHSATGIYRALGSSKPGLFGSLQTLDFQMDANPIQPGYLDAFDVYHHSGIVNDIAMLISAKNLRAAHGFSDDTDVSIGFHALAYLIFGEDSKRPLTQLQAQTQTPQQRDKTGLKVNDLPSNRRRQLIKLLSELLLDDARQLQQLWQSENGRLQQNYRALAADSRLQLIQAASQQFLQRQQQMLAEQNPENRHNRFAKQDTASIHTALTALDTTFDTQLSTLLHDQDTAAIWQQQLQAALAASAQAPKIQ